ncbi:hypothetical protein EV363DRAFT_1454336 [Boletus edulis]|nr:hypothetical protein EV363DRAFT_1454336 [Boletus edulis]
MGRPKLHATPEERVLAARRYRAKYQEKNRAVINQKLVAKRRLLKSAHKDTAREPVKLLGKPTGSATLSRRAGHPKKNDISTSTTRSATSEDSESAILRELKDLIGTSARQWIDGLCKAFISSKDCRDISRILSTLGALGERLRKLSFRQWTSAGNTTESTLSKSTSAIIKSLEDLCLKAMEDEDIKNLAERGLLLYQDKYHPRLLHSPDIPLRSSVAVRRMPASNRRRTRRDRTNLRPFPLTASQIAWAMDLFYRRGSWAFGSREEGAIYFQVLAEVFNDRWSMREMLFPEIPPEVELDQNQRDLLSAAMMHLAVRLVRLWRWVQWGRTEFGLNFGAFEGGLG